MTELEDVITGLVDLVADRTDQEPEDVEAVLCVYLQSETFVNNLLDFCA